MYKGTFKAFTRLLPPGGRVVIIFPEFTMKSGRTLTTKQTLKDAEEMGFTKILGPLRAGRTTAHTQRQVFVLEYQPYGTR
jgi:1-acyl-sn-glycerol-3-phosphate acyltransferase